MTSQNDTIYLLYKNAGFCWSLALSAILLNAMSIPGMFLNFAVIWVTFRTKCLHGTANYLLGLCSLFELLHEAGHLLFLWTALSGQNFIPYWLAIRICTVPMFGLGAVSPAMAFTGLDRMLCVLIPKFPMVVKPVMYLGTLTAICSAFGFFMLFNIYKNDVEPGLMITGTIGDINQGSAGSIYTNFSFLFNNVMIILYIIVGILVKYRTVEKSQWRIFRSLIIIITFNLAGYYFMRLFRLIIGPLISSPQTYWFAMQAISVLLNMSAASNGPILYFTSKEYRNAFRHEYASLKRLLGNKIVVKPVTNSTRIATVKVPRNVLIITNKELTAH